MWYNYTTLRKGDFIMSHIIPIRDLKNTAAISELCNSSEEPIFVTKNGYGDMVLMSMEVYNRTLAKMQLYEALKKGEDELINGAPKIELHEALTEIRKKYGI